MKSAISSTFRDFGLRIIYHFSYENLGNCSSFFYLTTKSWNHINYFLKREETFLVSGALPPFININQFSFVYVGYFIMKLNLWFIDIIDINCILTYFNLPYI